LFSSSDGVNKVPLTTPAPRELLALTRDLATLSAPIRPRDDLENVAIEIFEIYAATAIVMVDLVGPRFPRICPVT
jgi:hypothetical protein